MKIRGPVVIAVMTISVLSAATFTQADEIRERNSWERSPVTQPDKWIGGGAVRYRPGIRSSDSNKCGQLLFPQSGTNLGPVVSECPKPETKDGRPSRRRDNQHQ